MVLITLGTQDKQFVRLLEQVQNLIDKKILTEEVVAQIGCTKFESNDIKVFDLIPFTEFDKLITHGGVGSILTGLRYNKKVIAVPRLKKYNEHVNDHQVQIIARLSEEGYILDGSSLENLDNIFKSASTFTPKKLELNNKLMKDTVNKFLKDI